MNQNNPAITIGMMALIVIAFAQIIGLLERSNKDLGAKIGAAYEKGYTEGEADGWMAGLNSASIHSHEIGCHCDSCVENGQTNPFLTK